MGNEISGATVRERELPKRSDWRDQSTFQLSKDPTVSNRFLLKKKKKERIFMGGANITLCNRDVEIGVKASGN